MRLYGKRPVIERLKAAPETIRMLYLQQETDSSEVVQAAKAIKRPFVSLSKPAFAKLAGEEVHAQGVLAEVDPFRYIPLADLLKRPETQRPTLFLLDRVTDPQNLGNILRTLACFGRMAIVLPKHDSAEINETVLRIACGGENYVPVAQVTNLVTACELAKEAGTWIVGAVVSGGTPLPQVSWPHPLGVVIGSEGEGIRPGLKKHLELTVTLPMQGAALSFNVATATTLIAYEIAVRVPPVPGTKGTHTSR
ncbi:MAG: 23S rRNA (guanosine(2251)-2'-O)-methyltransferase RlmB [Candidatus Omnitrophica bacterium]|nr:23S rRNA (guanosine(2251)-2'-O)-methyltransferase RlmB [Candidatus Omnitrophota bacterium]